MCELRFHARAGAATPLLLTGLLGLIPGLLFSIPAVVLHGVGWAEIFAHSKSASQTHTVLIKDFKYVPETLTVKAGDTVIWKNEDLVPHTATANGKSFDSKNIASKASWKYVANKPGTYPYLCTYHPTMKARLIVQ